MEKRIKIAYWISTGLLSALLLMSASMYIFNNEEITAIFSTLGYPTYIIYPLAALKITGMTVLLVSKSQKLREWAYIGFFFNFVLAFFAHLTIGDGEYYGALMAITLLITSYTSNAKKQTIKNKLAMS